MRAVWACWLTLVAGLGSGGGPGGGPVWGAAGRELDPAACAARFDVQRDKIIRTEESRDMGARYLSELDVGARHECLRLCCETDACDVFVYEEKSPGSCYLFNCGPPEDFRCKFTAHSNFSSGVLALSRRLAELQDLERLAHQQHAPPPLRVSAPTASSAAPAAPTAPGRALQTPAGRCSRYQFECRRGGECIAVYNACDGVPQCADASDEAPELGCPPRAEPSPPAPPPPPPATTQRAPTAAPPREQAAEGEAPRAAAAERWPHRLAQAQPPRRYNEMGSSSHIFSHKGGLLQEPESAQFSPMEPPWPRRWPPQGVEGMGGERGWGGSAGAPRRQWSEPEQRPQWPEAEPRPQWPEPDPRPQWPEPEPRPEWPEPDPRRAWPVPQPRPDPGGGTMPEVGVYSGQQHSLRDAPKKGLELSAPPRSSPSPSSHTRMPYKKPASAGGIGAMDAGEVRGGVGPVSGVPAGGGPATGGSGPAAGSSGPTAAGGPAGAKGPVGGGGPAGSGAGPVGALSAPDDHDGLSEHPPAAVLLLVLGMGMAVSLGAMAVCRARARRRLRRGRTPLAHDADYLVNGMYL